MASLLFLGVSVLAFIMTYGIVFLVCAAVLGTSFTALEAVPIGSTAWKAMFTRLDTELQFLVPLAAGIGMFMLVLKVLMSSSVHGRD